MNTCPCCSDSMLRHIRQKEIYWYCLSCHQEMPNLTSLMSHKNLSITTKTTRKLLGYQSSEKSSWVMA